jgi:hypothetical protein
MQLPDFHDGFFDGLWLRDKDTAILFLRTLSGERYSLQLGKVDTLRLDNLREGNIVFDVTVEVLTDQNQKMNLEVSASYGAELTARCENISVTQGHSVEAR